MKLYFLRHADAMPGEPDEERPLSPKGRKQSQAIANFLEEIEVEFDVAYSSPLVRARETAELVLAVTNHRVWVKLDLVDELRNETAPKEFNRWLKDLPDAKHVLLVGHNPSMSERVGSLLSISHPDGFNMPKGSLACLKTDDHVHASLEFFITPKVLAD